MYRRGGQSPAPPPPFGGEGWGEGGAPCGEVSGDEDHNNKDRAIARDGPHPNPLPPSGIRERNTARWHMRLSKKADYALRVLFTLVDEFGRGPQSLTQLALRNDVPRKFLEHIMLELKVHGWVASTAGRHGGY